MSRTDTEQLRFNNSVLQQTYEQVHKTLDSHRNNLDAISDDIKVLEKYIDGCGVRVEVCMSISDSGRQGAVGCEISGSIFRDEEYLLWAEDSSSKRWRLMYRKVRWHGDIDVDSTCTNEEEMEFRALIEAPASVRIDAWGHLANLLSCVAAQVSAPECRVQPPVETPFI